MAKQIYNFELFTNKKEQLRRIQRQRTRRRQARWIFTACILVLILIVFLMIQNSRCRYYVYSEARDSESSNEVTYETFAGGYIKYSADGVEYQRQFGRAVWNVPVRYEHPYSARSSAYFLLADKKSNVLMIFDRRGKVNSLTLKYPVLQAGISDQGIIEVILDGGDSSFVQMYNKDGSMIADMKTSVDETGYPVTAAISPDGTQLAVSFFAISGVNAKTKIAIYDFSRQLQNDTVNLKGVFEYKDYMIPKLTFTTGKLLAAFGEDKTFFYDISDKPELVRTLEFKERIESVFEGKRHIGYILQNTADPRQGRYLLCLYSRSGFKKLQVPVDMNYDKIRMVGSQILATRGNECTIINSRGRVIFQETLEGNGIESILPAFGWRSYHVIFRDRIVRMSLRFWGAD